MDIEIIDDNIQLSKQMGKSFTKKWHHVTIYNSRDDFLSHSQFSPDVFIMDIQLWDGNWLDLIEHLRKIEKIETPIILVSGETETKTKVEWFNVWADDFLEKPFSVQELHARVENICKRNTNKKQTQISSNTHISLSEKEKNKIFHTD